MGTAVYNIVSNRGQFVTPFRPRAAQLCRVVVPIGQKVKEVMGDRRPKISVTAFAEAIGRSRKNIYQIFEAASIDTMLLRKIGTVLNHDFFQYLDTPPAYPESTATAPAANDDAAKYGEDRSALVARLLEEVAKLSKTVPTLVKTNSELWEKFLQMEKERDELQKELKALRSKRTA